MQKDLKNALKIFEMGSTWLRADFHLHTRSDKEFVYKNTHDNSAPDAWFTHDYVTALEEKRIRVGAITNHNKFNFDEFKQLSQLARQKEIHLIPGVELSIHEGASGVHLLVLFNECWLENSGYALVDFISQAFQGRPPEQYENENAVSSLSLIDVVKKLDELCKGTKRDYSLIAAHVEEGHGLWKELGEGQLENFARQPEFASLRRRLLGFQKARGKDKSSRIAGLWKKYECHLPAFVEGSDPKSIEEIGRGEPCWVKIGAFTFEALSYALWDHEHRLQTRELSTEKTHSQIQSISFECQGGFLKNSFFRFSPELNAIIGIRGSGKSALLETLRYTLDIPSSENIDDAFYKQNLVKYAMGSGGKATVQAVDRYGQVFQISRIYGEAPGASLNGALQPGVSIGGTILHKPLYFGQKDLVNSSANSANSLIERLIGFHLQEIRKEISAQQERVKELIRKWQKFQNLEQEKSEYEKQKGDAECNLRLYQKYHIEEKLQRQINFEADIQRAAQIKECASAYFRSLENVVSENEDDLRSAAAYQAKEQTNQPIFDEYMIIYQELLGHFDKIKELCVQNVHTLKKLSYQEGELSKRYVELKEDFAQIQRDLSTELQAQGDSVIRPDDFLKQKKKLDTAVLMLQTFENAQKDQENAYNELLTALDRLNELWLQEYQKIRQELQRLNGQNTSLSISIAFKGDTDAYLDFLKSMVRGSGLRSSTLENLVQDHPDFSSMFRNRKKLLSELGEKAYESFWPSFMKDLPSFLTWQPPNRYEICYQGRPLQEHSLGQRASALMLFILSQQDNDLIIIDQPEDDMDNQTIYKDVIRLIKVIKPQIQLIFATHNANIPVLGDAELVSLCRNRNDSIDVQSGSIDDVQMQRAVVNIMEGGKEAFQLRKEIYNRWNSEN